MNKFADVLQNSKSCALIGSREVPDFYFYYMVEIGKKLSELGILGYSGGATGSDSHFLKEYKENARIILPKNGFNDLIANNVTIFDGSKADKYLCDEELLKILSNIDKSNYILEKYRRNTLQIRTETQDKFVDFVLYYAPEYRRSVIGGTRIAVYLARHYKIPCFNLFDETDFNDVCNSLNINTKSENLFDLL